MRTFVTGFAAAIIIAAALALLLGPTFGAEANMPTIPAVR